MSALRKIVYVTGTRADFGLMLACLRVLAASPKISLSILVTGMHLDPEFGDTATEVVDSGLVVGATVQVDLRGRDGATMARATGEMLVGMTRELNRMQPDLVVLLGDRGEMLAAAIACLNLGIPTAHLHGGERSGTVDEPVRHAISKLCSYHLCATEQSAKRLRKMGEDARRIFVVGTPGLVGLAACADAGRVKFRARMERHFGGEALDRFLLVVFHPVAQQASTMGDQTRALLDALSCLSLPVVWLKPNADAGSIGILAELQRFSDAPWLLTLAHLPRDEFCAAMQATLALVGNSSSGIIEAASFGTPVVNIGSRQHMRERSANALDTAPEQVAISITLQRALDFRRESITNVYGDDKAAVRVLDILSHLPLDEHVTEKCNEY